MKIINYKKLKNNCYEINLDNESKVKLYDEVILNNGLLLKKEIDLKTLNKLIIENEYYELYNLVLKYISRKMRSEKEIYNKYKDYSKNNIDKVISKLKEQNYLNEDNYLNAYVNDEINLKTVGYNKIKKDLIDLGISYEKVVSKLDDIDEEIWREKIKKIVDNMIKNNRKYGKNMLLLKINNYLINKGFRKEEIASYLENVDIKIDDELKEKEYAKLKAKLIRKYSDDELEWEIKKRLHNKGF